MSGRIGRAAVGAFPGPVLGTGWLASGGGVAGWLLANLDRLGKSGVPNRLVEGQCFRESLVLSDRGMGHALLVGKDDVVVLGKPPPADVKVPVRPVVRVDTYSQKAAHDFSLLQHDTLALMAERQQLADMALVTRAPDIGHPRTIAGTVAGRPKCMRHLGRGDEKSRAEPAAKLADVNFR